MALPIIGRFLLFAGLPVVIHVLRRNAESRRAINPASRGAKAMDAAARGLAVASALGSLRGGRKGWMLRAGRAALVSRVVRRWRKGSLSAGT